jgi:hypothetical protein
LRCNTTAVAAEKSKENACEYISNEFFSKDVILSKYKEKKDFFSKNDESLNPRL